MSIKGRPAFMEMMDDISCEKDEISCVLVFKLSRFGRNAADILKSVQLLMDFDVDLVCVEDAIDSSTQGGRLTLAADLVRLIYQKYLESDMKLNTVVGWLNDNGYKRVVKGEDRVITSDFVSSVLGNPVYYGMIVYNRRTNSEEIKRNPKEIISVRGKYEAIIPEDIWMQVQEKRKMLRKQNKKVDNPERISLLSGLVKCPECGSGMVTKKNKRKNNNHGGYYKIVYSYGCRNTRKSEGHVCSCRRTYNQDKLDRAVMEIVGKVTETKEFRQAVMNTVGDRSSLDACEADLKMTRKELHSQEHLKYKLGMELDNLDVLAENYDDEYEAVQSKIDEVYDRSQIHIGTILYQIVYSLCVDLFANAHVYSTHLWVNALIMVSGVMLFSVGTGFYAVASLGRGSYEALTFSLAQKNGWQVKAVRMMLDILVVAAGVLMGGKFGMCTIVTIIISEPVIQFTASKTKKLFEM